MPRAVTTPSDRKTEGTAEARGAAAGLPEGRPALGRGGALSRVIRRPWRRCRAPLPLLQIGRPKEQLKREAPPPAFRRGGQHLAVAERSVASFADRGVDAARRYHSFRSEDRRNS